MPFKEDLSLLELNQRRFIINQAQESKRKNAKEGKKQAALTEATPPSFKGYEIKAITILASDQDEVIWKIDTQISQVSRL